MATPPKPMQRLTVVVTEVTPAAKGAVTIKMQPLSPPDYLAGQFISIDPNQFPELEHWIKHLKTLKKRKEPRRSYSLSSAPFENGIAISVKAESFDPEHEPYPPLLSPFLVHHIKPGRQIDVMAYSGRYTLEGHVPEGVDTIIHVCAGSGFVPNFGMIKSDLHGGHYNHTLLLSNRTREDVFFLSELEMLQNCYPERLKVSHFLTREPNAEGFGSSYTSGRISAEHIRAVAPDPNAFAYFLCGPGIGPREKRAARKEGKVLPNRFLESMIEAFESLGIEEERINKESW